MTHTTSPLWLCVLRDAITIHTPLKLGHTTLLYARETLVITRPHVTSVEGESFRALSVDASSNELEVPWSLLQISSLHQAPCPFIMEL